MKLTIALALSLAVGCAGATKKPTQPQARTGDTGCPDWGCGSNGTRSTGTADDTAPRVESVSLIENCPTFMCGSNGTRAVGTADDRTLHVEAVVLPSGEPAQTRCSSDRAQRRAAAAWLALAIAAMTAACGAAQPHRPTTSPERGELVVRTATGREVRSAGLVGAVLDLGPQSVRIPSA